jgi:acetoin utilization protein AcuB
MCAACACIGRRDPLAAEEGSDATGRHHEPRVPSGGLRQPGRRPADHREVRTVVDAPVSAILARSPRTVSLDDSLRLVRQVMAAERIRHVVVVDEGIVVGLVSDRDVLGALSPTADNERIARPADVATLEKRVHQIMSRKLVSVGPATPVTEAARLMLEHRINCLPVVDGRGRCAGVVTSVDVLEWSLALAAEATRDR